MHGKKPGRGLEDHRKNGGKVQNRNGNDLTYLGESAIDAAQSGDEQLQVAISESRHVDAALLLRHLSLLVRHIEIEDSLEF